MAVRGPSRLLERQAVAVGARDVGRLEGRRDHHVQSERREDTLSQEVRQGQATHLGDHLGEQHIVRVRVDVSRSRVELGLAPDRLHGRLLIGRAGEADAGLVELDPEVGDAAGVMDELIERDRVPPRRQARDVGADRVRYGEQSLALEHQDGGRGELLRDRRDVEAGRVVTGVPAARSARPPAPAQITSPSTPTAAEHPGQSGRNQFGERRVAALGQLGDLVARERRRRGGLDGAPIGEDRAAGEEHQTDAGDGGQSNPPRRSHVPTVTGGGGLSPLLEHRPHLGDRLAGLEVVGILDDLDGGALEERDDDG